VLKLERVSTDDVKEGAVNSGELKKALLSKMRCGQRGVLSQKEGKHRGFALRVSIHSGDRTPAAWAADLKTRLC